jgi:iron(III) transport system ATP-binding protein
MAMSDKIVILKDGIVQQVGSPQEVYYKPANTFVSNFIGKANIVEGNVIAVKSDIVTIKIQNKEYDVKHRNAKTFKIKEAVDIVVRPEAVDLTLDYFKSVVKKTVYMGVSQDYWFDFANKEIEVSDYNPSSKRVYKEGEEITFGFQEESIHILHKI